MQKKINIKSKPLLNNLKESISKNLDLPTEIILNIPLITITGNKETKIENFKNILEYSNNKIRINTSCGILKIEGNLLYLKELSKDKLLIKGNISKFEFIL